MSAKEVVAVTVETAESALTSFLSAPVDVQLRATGNFVRTNPAECGPVANQLEKVLGRFLAGLALQAKNAGHLQYDGLVFANPGGEEEKKWREKGATDAKTDLSDEALEKASATVTGSVDGDGVHVKAKEVPAHEVCAYNLAHLTPPITRDGNEFHRDGWPTSVSSKGLNAAYKTLLPDFADVEEKVFAKALPIAFPRVKKA